MRSQKCSHIIAALTIILIYSMASADNSRRQCLDQLDIADGFIWNVLPLLDEGPGSGNSHQELRMSLTLIDKSNLWNQYHASIISAGDRNGLYGHNNVPAQGMIVVDAEKSQAHILSQSGGTSVELSNKDKWGYFNFIFSYADGQDIAVAIDSKSRAIAMNDGSNSTGNKNLGLDDQALNDAIKSASALMSSAHPWKNTSSEDTRAPIKLNIDQTAVNDPVFDAPFSSIIERAPTVFENEVKYLQGLNDKQKSDLKAKFGKTPDEVITSYRKRFTDALTACQSTDQVIKDAASQSIAGIKSISNIGNSASAIGIPPASAGTAATPSAPASAATTQNGIR